MCGCSCQLRPACGFGFLPFVVLPFSLLSCQLCKELKPPVYLRPHSPARGAVCCCCGAPTTAHTEKEISPVTGLCLRGTAECGGRVCLPASGTPPSSSTGLLGKVSLFLPPPPKKKPRSCGIQQRFQWKFVKSAGLRLPTKVILV